ncbi:MAG: protein-glutamate O-methyltransferase CheR [Bacteroidetes bacterium]|nr:protein-glutamate O-methyltransferase CheR [Bacteroidota bacterium]
MTTRQFIEAVEFTFGKGLSVYSETFLKKTLARRMDEVNVVNLAGYLDYISGDHGELAELSETLNICYTIFFRSSIDLSLVEEFILPGLIQSRQKNNSDTLRIWSVGCADGPEAYTLAMLSDKVISDRNYHASVMVFGTDISLAALAKARLGMYDANMVQQVRLSYIDRYFTRKKSTYSVNDRIRSLVDFSQGDITDPGYSSPPAGIFADFDLVSCCNLMIYYNHDIQQMILEKLYQSISRNGYLLVGESEQLIVEQSGKFHQFSPYGNVFVKH